MEKLKYLSFALLIALCAGFVSCSDDDEGETTSGVPKPSVVKRLVKVTDYNDSRQYQYDIQYDANGRVNKVIETEEMFYDYGTGTVREYAYTYSPSQITVTETNSYGHSSTETYNLSNGLISECKGEYTCSYDNGRIAKWREVDGGSNTFTWSGGNITKTVRYDSGRSMTYEYSDKYDYGRIVGVVFESNSILYDDLDGYLVMQGFYGTTPTHLPLGGSLITESGYEAFNYEFDSDGYPTSVTRYCDGYESCTFTLTWETI